MGWNSYSRESSPTMTYLLLDTGCIHTFCLVCISAASSAGWILRGSLEDLPSPLFYKRKQRSTQSMYVSYPGGGSYQVEDWDPYSLPGNSTEHRNAALSITACKTPAVGHWKLCQIPMETSAGSPKEGEIEGRIVLVDILRVISSSL